MEGICTVCGTKTDAIWKTHCKACYAKKMKHEQKQTHADKFKKMPLKWRKELIDARAVTFKRTKSVSYRSDKVSKYNPHFTCQLSKPQSPMYAHSSPSLLATFSFKG